MDDQLIVGVLDKKHIEPSMRTTISHVEVAKELWNDIRDQLMEEKVSCRHCGKTRHEEANCFEVIGYPPGWIQWEGRGGRGRS